MRHRAGPPDHGACACHFVLQLLPLVARCITFCHAPGRNKSVDEGTSMLKPSAPGFRRAAASSGGVLGGRVCVWGGPQGRQPDCRHKGNASRFWFVGLVVRFRVYRTGTRVYVSCFPFSRFSTFFHVLFFSSELTGFCKPTPGPSSCSTAAQDRASRILGEVARRMATTAFCPQRQSQSRTARAVVSVIVCVCVCACVRVCARVRRNCLILRRHLMCECF